MKVHSKSPPPPGVFEPATTGTTNILSPTTSSESGSSQSLSSSGTIAATNLANNAGTNLSEWYVCQSAGGMPTPPSNEPSPVSGQTAVNGHSTNNNNSSGIPSSTSNSVTSY